VGTTEAGVAFLIGCHAFQAIGIIAYLEKGRLPRKRSGHGGHQSPRKHKVYDRTGDEITLNKVERIKI